VIDEIKRSASGRNDVDPPLRTVTVFASLPRLPEYTFGSRPRSIVGMSVIDDISPRGACAGRLWPLRARGGKSSQ
jgi:hypothetical protein